MDTDLLLKACLALGLVLILARCASKTREGYTDYTSYIPASKVPANSTLGASALLPVDSHLLPSEERPVLDGQAFIPPSRGLEKQSFLDLRSFLGLNSINGSNKNSNYGLRSEPPNPRLNVGPWQQSTIAPNIYRRPLDCP
jgi:hypothetical protein